MDLPKPESLETKLRDAARAIVTGRIAALSRRYSRSDALDRLRAPTQIDRRRDTQVVRWLKKALRNERGKAISGHWSYDANRHMMLSAALKRELSARTPAGGRRPET